MNVDTISNAGLTLPQQARPAEQIDSGRKAKESTVQMEQQSGGNQKVQPEELLDQIKKIAQDGAYSVRFERNDEISDVVVKIFDNETQEVVRQIPAEQILNFRASFEELIGNLVNTEG